MAIDSLGVFALPEKSAHPPVDLSRAKLPPFRHQAASTAFVCAHPYSLNASEMGVGKSKCCIDAACSMFVNNLIDRVIVVAPAGIRQVWCHPELGELKKHLWDGLPARVTEYHVKLKQWEQHWTEGPRLNWIVTNYEYLRSDERLTKLSFYCGPKTLLVCDESAAIKNAQAQQTKAVMKLRKACGRVHLMNGTPVSEGAGDLFSQGNIMSPSILDCPSKTQFKARYAVEVPVRGAGGQAMVKHGRTIMTVTGWRNLGDLEKRFAPYVIRYMKQDCLDLPEKLPTVPLFVPLKESWSVYKEMRDEAMVWLGKESSMSPQITTKLMRLSQITSGFLGGVAENDIEAMESGGFNDGGLYGVPLLERDWNPIDYTLDQRPPDVVEREVGSEKLDFLIEWLEQRVAEDKHFKVLIWSRHRHEILRTFERVKMMPEIDHRHVGTIIGGQKLGEREASVKLLDPRTSPDAPVVVIGSPHAGGKGLTLTAAHTVVYMSNGYSLGARLQSEDRVHRAGQRNVVSYFDLIATGPSGQKTVDLAVMAALQAKDDLSSATTAAWKSILQED